MVRRAVVKLKRMRKRRRKAGGQSLTEFSLALPILILLIAGIGEVGTLIVQKNRAALVARETARFVALGGDDHDALSVSQQSVEMSFGGQVIAFNEDHMNIYIIHATVNSGGTAIIDEVGDCSSQNDFCDTHIYPTENYFDTCGAECVPEISTSGWEPGEIYDRLSQDGTLPETDLENLQVVAAVVQYNTTTLLNLPIFPQTNGGIPLNEIAVMRQEATIAEAAGTPTQGCSAYPIAISDAATSDTLGNTFTTASEDEVFTTTFGTVAGNTYNFLLWNDTNLLPGDESTRLAVSLGSEQEAAGDPPVPNTRDTTYGYVHPVTPSDVSLHKGDDVLQNTSPTGADAMMADHIADKRTIRILAFSSYAGGAFTISDILIVKPTSFGSDQLEFEFVRRDTSCGN